MCVCMCRQVRQLPQNVVYKDAPSVFSTHRNAQGSMFCLFAFYVWIVQFVPCLPNGKVVMRDKKCLCKNKLSLSRRLFCLFVCCCGVFLCVCFFVFSYSAIPLTLIYMCFCLFVFPSFVFQISFMYNTHIFISRCGCIFIYILNECKSGCIVLNG